MAMDLDDTEKRIAEWEQGMREDSQGNTAEYNIADEAIEECKRLVQRLRAAEAIVRDLAEMSPVMVDSDIIECQICRHGSVGTVLARHGADCLYRRAVEATR
jgi:hypothetical protein